MQGRSPESESSFPTARRYVLAPLGAFSPDLLIKVDSVTGASSAASAATVVVAVSGVTMSGADSFSEAPLSSAAEPFKG